MNERGRRNTAHRNEMSMSETDNSDHDERVLAVIDRRTQPERRTQPRSGYAAAVRGLNNTNQAGPSRDTRDGNPRDQRNHERTTLSRRNSHRNLSDGNQSDTGRRDQRNQGEMPIHERIALSRRNSRRNLNHSQNPTMGTWGDSIDP